MNERMNKRPGWAMEKNSRENIEQSRQAIPPEVAFREYDAYCQQYQGDAQAEFEEKCKQMGLNAQQKQAVLQAAKRFSQLARMYKR